jgi:hypothetical protein
MGGLPKLAATAGALNGVVAMAATAGGAGAGDAIAGAGACDALAYAGDAVALAVNVKVNFFTSSRSFGPLDAKEQEFISNVIDYLHEGGEIRSRTVLSFIYRWIKRILSKN